ncbi:MAG: DUF433 domain-containing protein [Chloroflexota bacterium]
MSVQTLELHIESTPGIKNGKPRISGRRITVENIVIWHEWMGIAVDEIATQYDLTLAQIYAALSYYFDYREEINDSIKKSQAFVESLKKQIPSKLRFKSNHLSL